MVPKLAVFPPPLDTNDPFAIPAGGLHIFSFVLFTHGGRVLLERWGERLGLPNACLEYAEEPRAAALRVAQAHGVPVNEIELVEVISSEEQRLKHWNICFMYHVQAEAADERFRRPSDVADDLSLFVREDLAWDRLLQRSGLSA